ncbi:MAG: hypothetical protein AMQ22_00903 [Candidatus Methanofastidiosum methylothiophilum]|jgi:hypothetical protein|uniref:Uncharacterized protein n=1 Tax=Candidatus Methanofastidiosum methylothiophilum TaxID=1705564 RepID=A0A150J4X9_9EURY|nr:MAG: hypothetical protein AMQ22_00903 [Candidatus Methanofastidiosum methylthiophilus]
MLSNDLIMCNTKLSEAYSQLEIHCHDMARLVDCIGNSLFIINIIAEMKIEDQKTLEKILGEVIVIRSTLGEIEDKWGNSKVFKEKMLEYLLE